MAKRSAQEPSKAGLATTPPGLMAYLRTPHWWGAIAVLVMAIGGFFMIQILVEQLAEEKNKGRDQFAADRVGGDTIIEFDGKRTMGYLESICKIGARISGSEGMKKQQQLIEKHFKTLKAKVTYQRFTATQKSTGRPVEMANLIISYHPERTRRAILCSHYDTRPIADKEPNRKRWTDTFVSANDGGSGVALLMELGNHVADLKTNVGFDFVLFDGEEYIFVPDKDEYFFGSKHFAKEALKVRKKVTYTGAILLDMIAGKGATFPIELNSWDHASKLVREVWGIAKDLKCSSFKGNLSEFAVLDDHVPLNKAGIPAIDVIDFDYPHWHRLTDLPKNCSQETMAEVAKVCSVWLQRTK